MRYRFMISILLIHSAILVLPQSANKLWYNEPARFFEQSLVLGNGRMGASIFGGVEKDQVFLNDITLWSGGPVKADMNDEAYKNIPAIREALKNENYQLADQLQRKIQGKFSESYAPLGTLYLAFSHQEPASDYYRELDISKAVARVTYQTGRIKYSREYFVSSPAGIMVVRLTASQKGALNFNAGLKSQLHTQTSVSKNELYMTGNAPAIAKPDYLGNVEDAVVFDKTGTRFSAFISIGKHDGQIVISDSTIGLKGASFAEIMISVATSFNGYDKDPVLEGIDHKKLAYDKLQKARSTPYKKLLTEHITDFRTYFSRVILDLGKSTAPELPTDERLKRYARGEEDKNLEVLYFQYGRYLLISSSRTTGVPANLQGLWNPYMRPPWSSNYTMNINLEENYWLAENTNLSEMHMPLLSFIRNLSATGKITARTFLGVNGWTACHNSDIWAMSNPVGDFGNGDPVWANWYMAGPWLSTHLWEHYAYTLDKEWLKNEGYPLMKGAAEFCLEWLVPDKNGFLITSPSTSPENKYVTPDGYHGATLYGGTADIAIARECMQQTIEAAIILDTDTGFVARLEEAFSRLRPYQIGKRGNLMEWYYDWEDEDPKHRHQSHLFGLYPGHQITQALTPDLADASRKTLEMKGDETTGWSKGWRINLWARLQDGNRAYKMFRELLRYVDPDGMHTSYTGGGGTYPNLFDAHPPFQIDGNFGGAAAVAEMLIQSGNNEIILLPALPDTWQNGSVKGLCARGGYEVGIVWQDGKPIAATIKAKTDSSCKIVTSQHKINCNIKAGKTIKIKFP